MMRREELGDDSGIEDDRLRLMFTCCHPAIALEGRVALTLRALAGLTTTEIANAFLVPEPTMAKRLVRAKHKIEHAGIPYRVPPAHLLPERTSGVLAVLYLMFNEGYAASTGDELIRVDLCAEAIRLARLLNRLMPDEPESGGLLALLLFQHSRREARTDPAGDLITLEEQDRSRWNAGGDRPGERDSRRGRSPERHRSLPGASAHRRLPRQRATRRRDRLAPDRRPVRAAPRGHSESARQAQPRRRRRDGNRPRGCPRARRPAPSVGRTARLPPPARDPRRLPAQAGPQLRSRRRIPRQLSTWRAPTPSVVTSPNACRSSAPPQHQPKPKAPRAPRRPERRAADSTCLWRWARDR